LVGIEGLLLLEQLIFLEVRGEAVNLLAETHLLGIALVHEALLLVYELLLELALSDLLLLQLAGNLLLEALLLSLFALVAGFEFVIVLLKQGFVLFLLSVDPLHRFSVLSLLLLALLVGRVG